MDSKINKSEFPYQELMINTCVISFVLDKSSEILEANNQFYDTIGIVRSEGQSSLFKNFLSDDAKWLTYVSKLTDNENVITENIKIFNTVGNLIILKSNLSLRDGKIYVVALDITKDFHNLEFTNRVNQLTKLGGWTYNPKLDHADWTESVFEILDIKGQVDIHRDTILNFVHPYFVDEFNEAVRLLYDDHQPYDITIQVITKSSQTKWVRITATPEIRNHDIVFIHGTFQDVTFQKSQEIALQETTVNLELALKAMNSGYFTRDLVNPKCDYSAAFSELMDMPKNLNDEQLKKYVHPEDLEEAIMQFKREMATDSPNYINAFRLRTPKGTYRHYEIYGLKVFNSLGVPVKLVGNFIDVEDKYRLMEMEDKHRYYMKTLLDNAFVRSIMLDKDWNLLGMDAETLSIFKKRLDRNPVLRKENFKELLSVHDQLKFQIVERVINDGREYRNEVFLDLFEDDRTYYDALFKPILDYSNRVDGYVFYFFDLTERMNIKEELQIYQDKLRTVHNFKNNIVSKLGHEIKTPLYGLLEATKLIFAKESKPSEKAELIKAQQESADRLKTTFDNIINNSIYQDDFYLIEDRVNLEKILNRVYEGASKRAFDGKLKLIFKNFDGPAIVKGDSVFLRQAFENLIDNAFKFTRSGTIKIITSIKNSHVVVTITDTGIGIPQTKINEIFEPFEQVSTGSTRVFDGLGLGLTFTVKYIERIGGRLHVDSEINKGTTFTLALPLIE